VGTERVAPTFGHGGQPVELHLGRVDANRRGHPSHQQASGDVEIGVRRVQELVGAENPIRWSRWGARLPGWAETRDSLLMLAHGISFVVLTDSDAKTALSGPCPM
jgi:hypothetical protein